jgi:hypothetical protein
MNPTPAAVLPPTVPFNMALRDFLTKLTAMVAAHFAEHLPNVPPPSFVVDPGGKKFLRVVKVDNQRSVYCFISVADGGIMKPASWKAPAPSARGNIYNAEPLKGCGPYGVAYLR